MHCIALFSSLFEGTTLRSDSNQNRKGTGGGKGVVPITDFYLVNKWGCIILSGVIIFIVGLCCYLCWYRHAMQRSDKNKLLCVVKLLLI